ncbi:phospholipase D family protein [Salinigranum marinum]|uniref:phospholipase D family protein n=1 Tax=Salinigranum marinum TaxID=1515595 RepID=UPI002989BEC1|nr:phospholipase D family protein [Salinigranum marinum]
MVDQALFDNRLTGSLVAEAVVRLFEADGTIYLTSGYFTWSGFLTIRDALTEFLARSTDNEVYVVVATGADQFSRLVAHALWELDIDGRVHLLTYRDGFIHPKLYLRDGDDPALVMGSANLTWDGLGKNLELAWYYAPDARDDPIFQTHLAWVGPFIAECDPVTPTDLKRSVRLRRTTDVWLSKGRINVPSMIKGALPIRSRKTPQSPFSAPHEGDRDTGHGVPSHPRRDDP